MPELRRSALEIETRARTPARPYGVLAALREARLTPYAHRKVTQLRNERNAGFAFPCFYVTPWIRATSLSHPVQFHRVVLAIAVSVLYKRTSPTIKTQNRIGTVCKQRSTHSFRRWEFSRVTIDLLRKTKSKMRSHIIPVSDLLLYTYYFHRTHNVRNVGFVVVSDFN